MKKICAMIAVGVLAVAGAIGESDIQISMPIFSFFYNAYAEWNGFTSETHENFSAILEPIKLRNNNFLHSKRIGFYESCSVIGIGIVDPDESPFGVQFAVGGALKVYETETLLLDCSVGMHIKLGQDAFTLGAESDFQMKFTKNRRCSPIVGATINFDFYTTEKARIYYYDDYNHGYYGWTYTIGYEQLDSYFRFYIQPYIALGINF